MKNFVLKKITNLSDSHLVFRSLHNGDYHEKWRNRWDCVIVPFGTAWPAEIDSGCLMTEEENGAYELIIGGASSQILRTLYTKNGALWSRSRGIDTPEQIQAVPSDGNFELVVGISGSWHLTAKKPDGYRDSLTYPVPSFKLIHKIFNTWGDREATQLGKIYDFTFDNSFELFQTPNMWGDDGTGEYKDKQLINEMKKVVESASHFVDIVTLSPPTSAFREMLVTALKTLNAKRRAVVVRILYGESIAGMPRVEPITELQTLLKDVGMPEPPNESPFDVIIYIGVTAPYLNIAPDTTWNHSKIVAADGKAVIAGGHNMWEADYYGGAPVHDVSIKLTGTAAASAHRFCNVLWKHVAFANADSWNRPYGRSEAVSTKRKLEFRSLNSHNAMPIIELNHHISNRNFGVLAVGNVGRGTEYQDRKPLEGFNLSRDLRIKAIVFAEKSVRLSQQDFVGLLSYDTDFLGALADKIIMGVTVSAVLSDMGTSRDGNRYYWKDNNVWLAASKLYSEVMKRVGGNRERAIELLKKNAAIAPIRFGPTSTWKLSNGKRIRPANHAKCFIIDDRAFYIGSDNAYPHNLQEFGFFIETDGEIYGGVVKRFVDEYWSKLWQYSEPEKVNWDNISYAEE